MGRDLGGIEQRAELLDRILGDLYGAQSLLKSGAIPPRSSSATAAFSPLPRG
jgi:uncharacterized circularly permuted ATP-grasp superfamily protein